MRIEKTALDAQNRCVYSLYKEKGCIGHAVTCADCFEVLEIAPEWQSRGYGSYLLREVLRQNGGFDRTAPSEFTAPLPDAGNTAAQALAAKFGFVPRAGPDGSGADPPLFAQHTGTGRTVSGCHLRQRARYPIFMQRCRGKWPGDRAGYPASGRGQHQCAAGRQRHGCHWPRGMLRPSGAAALCPAGQCGLRDVQLWLAARCRARCTLHGRFHPARAAGRAGRPEARGVLAAVLYSGKVIGNAEKKAAAEFFRSLPLADYTVLICEFANWADTAPLPCFVIKREK